MRILFFLEPVFYRDDPAAVAAHFPWVRSIADFVKATDGTLALAANRQTCEIWAKNGLDPSQYLYPLDGFAVLQDFNLDKFAYAKAVYQGIDGASSLSIQLHAVIDDFKPDIVVATAQNAIASQAFAGIPILHIEQSPLPRFSCPFRTSFDPCGHQVGAFLERNRDRIRTLSLTDASFSQAQAIVSRVRSLPVERDSRALAAQEALLELGQGQKIAILATQPTDAVTFEGAYRPVEIHNLLFEWARDLPEGWIGVPTYHVGQRLSKEMEQALQSSCSNIRLLPPSYSQGFTEALIAVADGLVTISSTAAMAALLQGKAIAVVGQSPFSSWGGSRPADLSSTIPLSNREAISTFVFLSHRFTYLDQEITSGSAVFRSLMDRTLNGTIEEWLLDVDDWSPIKAEALFGLDVNDSRDESGRELADSGQVSNRPSQDACNAAIKSSIGLEELCSNLQEHLAAAIADRDRFDRERLEALSLISSLRENLAHAISDRDAKDTECATVVALNHSLRENLNLAISNREDITARHSQAEMLNQILRENLEQSIADRERKDDERAEAIMLNDILRENLDKAVQYKEQAERTICTIIAEREEMAQALQEMSETLRESQRRKSSRLYDTLRACFQKREP